MIVFYDGLCGFCDRTVQYVLDRDRQRNQFRFAALQGRLAEEVLPKHGKNPKNLDTLYVLTDDDQVYDKSDAAIRIFRALGKGSKFLSYLISMWPKPIRDWGYERFAAIRYRVFGKMDACRIPSPQDRAKFIGDDAAIKKPEPGSGE
jgi:predicted DCC family thiol-disulfide oxidoreductase YuxK